MHGLPNLKNNVHAFGLVNENPGLHFSWCLIDLIDNFKAF